jgi:hypothetical protein
MSTSHWSKFVECLQSAKFRAVRARTSTGPSPGLLQTIERFRRSKKVWWAQMDGSEIRMAVFEIQPRACGDTMSSFQVPSRSMLPGILIYSSILLP